MFALSLSIIKSNGMSNDINNISQQASDHEVILKSNRTKYLLTKFFCMATVKSSLKIIYPLTSTNNTHCGIVP